MRMNDTGSSAQREPTLSVDEAQHSSRVREHVVAAIAAAGVAKEQKTAAH